MIKMNKKEELDFFLETCNFIFFDESLPVISALLSKREKFGKKYISKTIDFISQEKNVSQNAASILISKISPCEAVVQITTKEGIDIIKIRTIQTALEICTFLKKSSDMDDFAVRINTSLQETQVIPAIKIQQQTWIIQNISMKSTDDSVKKRAQ